MTEAPKPALQKIAQPAAPAAAPNIRALSISPSPVRAGTPLKVSYETNATTGDVWLGDANGHEWSTAPLRSIGVTWLHVPAETEGRDMHVTLRATGTGGSTTSSASVSVLAADGAAAAEAAKPPAASAPVMTLSKDSVRSGYAFAVRVSGSSGAVRIASDAAGKTVAQSSSPDDGVITLAPPHVRAATTYYVIATIARGGSEMTLVRRISVTPIPTGR